VQYGSPSDYKKLMTNYDTAALEQHNLLGVNKIVDCEISAKKLVFGFSRN
jgi:hypothetical protein